ncbi:DUF2515 family protein [Bacillus sp. es.036]|uniref:DUF2515 family protein n=1 Tax=Bacillus sp. es.036 TaxID=1761764 RepID=UPI000BF86E68|nr:DUF2515 family protein [Bacillus sp. es.036]PFG15348.1 uncharacterized protein DUF2515 [Bacillus sp. es.036]
MKLSFPLFQSASKKEMPLMKELKEACHLSPPTLTLTGEEVKLTRIIREQTEQANRNNVTRTKAYLDFYLKHPEVHWAFLAHLVSRNAGWTMTDLRGEYLPRFLSPDDQHAFFSFLERGNWLIFQDAYPQLLIYEESLKVNKPLFHLLSAFHVSSFMKVIWNRFWKDKASDTLSVALIINEQHYIDSRVINDQHFHQTVFNTLPFQIQNVFNMNVLLFPLIRNGSIQLIGEPANHFLFVKERIVLGKRLYQLVFSNESTLNEILEWSTCHSHTGSRKDFWPELFHFIKEGQPDEKRVLDQCTLKKGPRLYSPLLSVWKDVQHDSPDRKDWFVNTSALSLFKLPDPDFSGNAAKIYCRSLHLLESLL